ncbi:MAG: hypothetical protein II185_00760 [Firmicutes bacterium]|nr:hypothetical protein [Bacillota bacterium]
MFVVKREIYKGYVSKERIEAICSLKVETVGYMYYPMIVCNGGTIILEYHNQGVVGFMNSFAPKVKLIINCKAENTVLELVLRPKKELVSGIAVWGGITFVLGCIVLCTNLFDGSAIEPIHIMPFVLSFLGVGLSILEYYGSVWYYTKVFKSSFLRQINLNE